jgi:hypothetical protein
VHRGFGAVAAAECLLPGAAPLTGSH